MPLSDDTRWPKRNLLPQYASRRGRVAMPTRRRRPLVLPDIWACYSITAEEPLALYNWYVQRGEAEQWIKDLKDACFADRLSCHRFWANQFRLLLHAAAYWLLDAVRGWLVQTSVARLQLDTVRLRLVKIGGWVRERLDGLQLHLANGHPGEPLWHHLSAQLKPHEESRLAASPGE